MSKAIEELRARMEELSLHDVHVKSTLMIMRYGGMQEVEALMRLAIAQAELLQDLRTAVQKKLLGDSIDDIKAKYRG